jgi:hypothetical protein
MWSACCRVGHGNMYDTCPTLFLQSPRKKVECTGHGYNTLFLPFIFHFLSKKTTLLVFLIFLMFLHLHRRPLSRRRPSMRFVLFFFPCFILFVFLHVLFSAFVGWWVFTWAYTFIYLYSSYTFIFNGFCHLVFLIVQTSGFSECGVTRIWFV